MTPTPPIILTLTRSIEIFDGILHDHMRCVKYLMVEVELAPLFKDTESDVPKYGVWGVTIISPTFINNSRCYGGYPRMPSLTRRISKSSTFL